MKERRDCCLNKQTRSCQRSPSLLFQGCFQRTTEERTRNQTKAASGPRSSVLCHKDSYTSLTHFLYLLEVCVVGDLLSVSQPPRLENNHTETELFAILFGQ